MYNTYNIDRQIEDLQRLKTQYQNQQPTNIFNVGNGQNIDFEARMLGDNEKVDEILVQRKTAFISLKNRQLSIKELNGDITTYEIVLPLDEKDKKIMELERRLNELEQYNSTNTEKCEPTATNNEYDESTTKTTRTSISKQSK